MNFAAQEILSWDVVCVGIFTTVSVSHKDFFPRNFTQELLPQEFSHVRQISQEFCRIGTFTMQEHYPGNFATYEVLPQELSVMYVRTLSQEFCAKGTFTIQTSPCRMITLGTLTLGTFNLRTLPCRNLVAKTLYLSNMIKQKHFPQEHCHIGNFNLEYLPGGTFALGTLPHRYFEPGNVAKWEL